MPNFLCPLILAPAAPHRPPPHAFAAQRYYRGNDMVPYSYCVQACGPSETDGTGSLGGGKTTVASYEDLKKCWYWCNGKTVRNGRRGAVV